MRKLLLLILLLTLASVVLAQDDADEPLTYPEDINPLTGLPVDDPAVLNQRPIVVKIVNAPAEARPQYGLPQADLVWEYSLVGGWTRFAAVFLSQAPERVGPIRSLRLADFEITRIYEALVATSGMSVGTLERLRADEIMPRRIISGTDECPALCRDSSIEDRGIEYTLFANVPALRELAEELERDTTPAPVRGMTFAEEAPAGGTGLDRIAINYEQAAIEWSYAAERGVWLRWHDGEAHLDAASGEQLAAENVVVLEAQHTAEPALTPDYWGYSNVAFGVSLVGEGRVVLLRDGQYFEGTWRREDRDSPLAFHDAEGEPLAFKPGKTYITLVPTWAGSYTLGFFLADPPSATVTADSLNLRWGPTINFRAGDAAYQGDTLRAVGRNADGTWVNVWRDDDRLLWASIDLIDLDTDVMALPLVRPADEG